MAPMTHQIMTEIQANLEAGWSENTAKCYIRHIMAFRSHCEKKGTDWTQLYPEDVVSFVREWAEGRSRSHLQQAVCALEIVAHLRQRPSIAEVPEVKVSLRRELRARPVKPRRQAIPMSLEDLHRLMDASPPAERALYVISFAGGLRRSEALNLRVEDVSFVAEGATLLIRRSKTDQHGAGAKVAIPRTSDAYCPVDHLRRQVDAARYVGSEWLFFSTGPLTKTTYDSKLQEAQERAGMEGHYSSHSFRAGFATSALDAGADVLAVAKGGRWKSVETVSIYDRRALWNAPASAAALSSRKGMPPRGAA